MKMQEYALLDSGEGAKLEQFGEFTLVRPCAQALWRPFLPKHVWESADAVFSREGKNLWTRRKKIKESWTTLLHGLEFKTSLTDFGHVGLFPEHSLFWKEMEQLIASRQEKVSVLNLFAYSGGASLAAARAGASVCHLDASKGMVAWARDNAQLNGLEKKEIRWIVDDALKFLRREVKRKVRYEGIILDPPSFGRGAQGEVFKIEEHLPEILSLCQSCLSEHPLFVIFSTHTAGMSPLASEHLITQMMGRKKGKIEAGEMTITPKQGGVLPCGSFAKWTNDN